MAVRWRIAILLAVITTINYIDRSVFGVVAPVVRGEFGIGDADYGLITSGFLLAYGVGQLISGPLIDRLGTKRADGQHVTGGSILVRQRGSKIFPGNNVGKGGDDTLFSKIDGVVKFERVGKKRKRVSVYAKEA